MTVLEAPAPRQVMSYRMMAVAGAILVAVGPLSMALYTPAMPEMTASLGTTAGMIKLSLAVYFAGLAFAQLICGPLADQHGRKPVIAAFTALYIAGTITVIAYPSVTTLLIGRAMQGVGACAGVALARAMVRDCFEGRAAARMMSTMGMIISTAPAVAPVLGGTITTVAGWQGVFWAMALYGFVILLVLRLLPETLPERLPGSLNLRRMASNYGALLAHRAYLRLVLASALVLSGIYAFAAMAPFVLMDEVGLPPARFGAVMALGSIAFFCGAMVTGRLLRRMDATRLIPVGLTLTSVSGLALAILLRAAEPSVAAVIVPMMGWAFGLAFVMPGAMMGALAPFPRIAGSASAMMGFLQMGGGMAASAAAAFFPSSVDAMASLPLALAATAVAVHLGLRPRKAVAPGG